MFKKLKTKSIISNSIIGMVLIAIGLGILLVKFGNVFLYLLPAKDLNELAATDVKAGMHVKGTFTYFPDYYAYSTQDGKNVEMEFFIPVGEEEFMGLVCRGSVMKDAEFDMNLFWQALEGDASVSESDLRDVKINGIVKKLEGDSLDFYRSYLSDLESETAELFIPYAVYNGIFAGTEDSDIGFALVFVVLMVVIGVALIIAGLAGNSIKDLTSYCKSQSDPNYAMQRVENFYQSGTPVCGIRAGDEFFIQISGNNVHFAESRECLWCYRQTVQHRINGIPTGKTYSVMMRLANGKSLELPMKNEDACLQALEYISQTMPYLIIGYDKSLETTYAKNRAEMVQAVSEKRNQTVAGTPTFESMGY